MAMRDLMYSPLDLVRRGAATVAWGPSVRFARSTIINLLEKIRIGRLTVIDSDGTEVICGFKGTDNEPETELVVHKDTFWVRMLLFTDMVRSAKILDMPIRHRCELHKADATITRDLQKVLC